MDATTGNTIAYIIGLIGALGGAAGLVAILRVRPDNNKTQSEANKINAETNRLSSEAWREFADRMELRVETLEKKTNSLEIENNRLRGLITYYIHGINMLIEQIKQSDKIPVWTPEDLKRRDDYVDKSDEPMV